MRGAEGCYMIQGRKTNAELNRTPEKIEEQSALIMEMKKGRNAYRMERNLRSIGGRNM